MTFAQKIEARDRNFLCGLLGATDAVFRPARDPADDVDTFEAMRHDYHLAGVLVGDGFTRDEADHARAVRCQVLRLVESGVLTARFKDGRVWVRLTDAADFDARAFLVRGAGPGMCRTFLRLLARADDWTPEPDAIRIPLDATGLAYADLALVAPCAVRGWLESRRTPTGIEYRPTLAGLRFAAAKTADPPTIPWPGDGVQLAAACYADGLRHKHEGLRQLMRLG